MNCYCNDEAYAQSSKTREITLGGSGGKCGLYTQPMFDDKSCVPLHAKKCGVGGCLALHMCVCSEPMFLDPKKWVNSMRKK